MNNYDPNLPDILRPTEIADFGDIFGTIRRVRQRVLLAVLLRAGPIVARLHSLTSEAAARAASNHPTASKS
jgi:hypothetical protein